MRKSLFHFNFDTCLIVQERTLFIRLMDIAYIRQAGMVEYVSVVLILHSMDTFIRWCLLVEIRVTLVTFLLHSFMYRLLMNSEINLPCKSRVTLITLILHSFM